MLTTIFPIYSSLVIISNNNRSYSFGFITTAIFLTSSPSHICSHVTAFLCKSKRGKKILYATFSTQFYNVKMHKVCMEWYLKHE